LQQQRNRTVVIAAAAQWNDRHFDRSAAEWRNLLFVRAAP
jgi:hypothetical protein